MVEYSEKKSAKKGAISENHIKFNPLISKNLSIFIPQLINKQGLRNTSTKGTYRNAVLRSKTKQLANILQDLYSFYPGPINIECRS